MTVAHPKTLVNDRPVDPGRRRIHRNGLPSDAPGPSRLWMALPCRPAETRRMISGFGGMADAGLRQTHGSIMEVTPWHPT